jgi:hypothetical protein
VSVRIYIGFMLVLAALCSLMVVPSIIEEHPAATCVVAAVGLLVWWRIRRNTDGHAVPPAQVVTATPATGEPRDDDRVS